MKTFYDYLSDIKKEYKYKLKFATKIGEEELDKLGIVLMKYDVLELTAPKKTILQYNQIDFPELGPVETWALTITSERPIYTPAIINDIAVSLSLHQRYVKVRSDHDPIEIDNRLMQELSDIDQIGNKEDEATAIGTQPIPDEIKVLYGDDYNKDLLTYLAKNRVQKNDRMTAAGIPTEFKFLQDLNVKTADFNAEYDVVKPVNAYEVKDADNNPLPATVTQVGAVSSNIIVAAKTYKLRDGGIMQIKTDLKGE